MKYVLLFFNEKTARDLTPAEHDSWVAFQDQARRDVTEVAAQALEPAATATVVTVRDGKRLTMDGPFVETKEQLGGFFLIDCENLEAALALAARVPIARTGHVEVRAVYEVY